MKKLNVVQSYKSTLSLTSALDRVDLPIYPLEEAPVLKMQEPRCVLVTVETCAQNLIPTEVGTLNYPAFSESTLKINNTN